MLEHLAFQWLRLGIVAVILTAGCGAQKAPTAGNPFEPGARVVLNAHNCYPYEGKYKDRIDRALSTGLPVSIELDLAWHRDGQQSRSVLSHETETHGDEPSLDAYFFERVRPLVEKSLAAGDSAAWPILYLHFNFKSNEREHVAHVAKTLAKYKDWLSSSVRVADPAQMQPILQRPVLVITETDDTEKAVFHDEVPVGERFYVFGSAPGDRYLPKDATRPQQLARMATAPPAEMLSRPADNYRRWWNNPWAVVEEGGAPRAGEWTEADSARLASLVSHAHRLGYLIRFYTLNGHPPESKEGWGSGYNFGDIGAARIRWEAARKAGVDFIASDQYEELGATLHRYSTAPRSATGQ
ncbi:MAG: hypothetical protein U5J83_03075 [Bryobacterales bacterium]|nr:hypothetical protein [Bryobacterales bacterium]